MLQPLLNFKFLSNARVAVIFCLLLGSVGRMASASSSGPVQVGQVKAPVSGGSNDEMTSMSGHMHMTSLRPLKDGDQQRADTIVAAAKQAMAPYQDYRKALADGYEIFLPNVPQSQYHFTKYEYGREAWSHFDPLKPTSLLYTKTADGGYKLVGAMYTARVEANEDELNSRIPHTLVPMRSLA